MIPPAIVIADEIVADLVKRIKGGMTDRDAMNAFARERLDAAGVCGEASYLVWRACSILRTKVPG